MKKASINCFCSKRQLTRELQLEKQYRIDCVCVNYENKITVPKSDASDRVRKYFPLLAVLN